MTNSQMDEAPESDSRVQEQSEEEGFTFEKLFCDEESDELKLRFGFLYPNLNSIGLNQLARKQLDPNGTLGENVSDFSLRDLIAVSETGRFESRVYPMIQLTGRWKGSLRLRNLWGSDFQVDGVFFHRKLDSNRGQKILCADLSLDVSINSDGTRIGDKDKELLLSLLGHSEDHIYFKDCNSRFLRASLSLTKRFGLKYPHEVIGKTDFDFFDIEHASEAYQDEQRVLETGVGIVDKEEKEIWEDGSCSWAASTKLPFFNANGKVVGIIGVSRDITERKLGEAKRRELETKLQLAQRLESIGSLAAGVAHEINTPTQFVADNIRFMEEAFGDILNALKSYRKICDKAKHGVVLSEEWAELDKKFEDAEIDYLEEEVPQTLKQTLDGLSQVSRIVGSLKEFSYPTSHEIAGADLNRAIGNTITIARNEWKYVAELERDFAPNLPEVPCFVDEINQVVLNLIINAAHAIEAAGKGVGKITVRTRLIDDSASIEITDTGTGIPYDIRNRLFEPFFTTKEVGKGTGQGLAMVQNIVVKNHSGKIDFESVMNEGTTFRVLLPLASPQKSDSNQP